MEVLADPFLNGENLKTRIRSIWFFFVMLLFPVGIYCLGRIFENPITEALVPLFPAEKDKGFLFYLDFVRLCLNEILWLSFFLVIVWWMIAVPGRLMKRHVMISASHMRVVVIIAVYFCVTLSVSWFALEAFPNSSDEYAYLMQAKTLSAGKLAEEAPPFGEAFHYNHIAIKDGIRVGRFPPGWPLLLSLSDAVGIPDWLVNPVLGTIALILFYSFAVKYYSREAALWSVAIVAFSSYFIFNAASYFSHTSCFLGILGFVWMFKRFENDRKVTYLLTAGFCLGLVSVIRYYTAVLIFFPFFAYILYHHKLRSLKLFFWIILGSLPWTMFLFWYNFSLTGSAFTPVTVWAYNDEQLGFVKGHTLLKGLEHVIRRIFMFMYWCSPGMLILYFLFLWQKLKSSVARWNHPEDYMFVVLLIGHFFYYQIGGNQYGPRFLLEAFPFLSLFVARSVLQSRFSPGYAALLIAGLVFSIAKFPSIVIREARIVDERQDVYDLVSERHLSNAVIIVSSSTSPVRPMPIGDLTRNGGDFQRSVLYVQDVPELNEMITHYYPKRSFYRYVRDPNQLHGSLIRIQ
jgi:hypothetical protein